MLTQADINVFSTVSFETYCPQILGTVYKGAKILSLPDADSVRLAGVDIAAKYANIYPFLPEGSPKAYDRCLYLKLKLVSGSIDYVALPWIKPETYKEVQTTNINISFQGVDFDMAAELQLLLSSAGHTGFTITTD